VGHRSRFPLSWLLFAWPLANAGDGMLDPAFGDDGRLVVSPADASLTGYSAWTQADGKVVIAGSRRHVGDEPFDNAIDVWRVLADGRFDSTFGNAGVVTVDFGRDARVPFGIASDRQGRILVTASPGFTVLRFTAAGAVDGTFGEGGSASVDFSALGYEVSYAYGLAVDAAGHVLVAGAVHRDSSPSSGRDGAIARLLPDGAPDPVFGDAGRIVVAVGTLATRQASFRSVRSRTDGSAHAVGAATNGDVDARSGFLAVKLDATGALDPGFGTGGIALLPPQYPVGGDGARQFFVHADGLLVAGYCGWGGDDDSGATLCAVRLQADGDLDLAYGVDGWVRATTVPRVLRSRTSAMLQGDRRLVLAAARMPVGEHASVVARFDADGVIDTTFGDGEGHVELGAASTGITGFQAYAVAPQAGRIVVAGDADGAPHVRALAAVRLDNGPIFADGFD
jgi:uncharacterized delta-60 repeat protein